MIKFNNVYLKYVNEFYSLYDFSCEINSHTLFVGDFFSGTTAIMRTLSKIDKNYTGKIIVDGVNLKYIKDKNLNLIYLPQKPILFKNKSIFKNLYYPLKLRKINKKNAKSLINNLFEEIKNNGFNKLPNYSICDIFKFKIKKLNLSEQKIVTLIRAILRKPKYILLENFFEDLDDNHIEIAKYLINNLKLTSTLIACENKRNIIFDDFKIINLTDEKKED